jgi:hypothetical protein
MFPPIAMRWAHVSHTYCVLHIFETKGHSICLARLGCSVWTVAASHSASAAASDDPAAAFFGFTFAVGSIETRDFQG